jgi:hypothetical protein
MLYYIQGKGKKPKAERYITGMYQKESSPKSEIYLSVIILSQNESKIGCLKLILERLASPMEEIEQQFSESVICGSYNALL